MVSGARISVPAVTAGNIAAITRIRSAAWASPSSATESTPRPIRHTLSQWSRRPSSARHEGPAEIHRRDVQPREGRRVPLGQHEQRDGRGAPRRHGGAPPGITIYGSRRSTASRSSKASSSTGSASSPRRRIAVRGSPQPPQQFYVETEPLPPEVIQAMRRASSVTAPSGTRTPRRSATSSQHTASTRT